MSPNLKRTFPGTHTHVTGELKQVSVDCVRTFGGGGWINLLIGPLLFLLLVAHLTQGPGQHQAILTNESRGDCYSNLTVQGSNPQPHLFTPLSMVMDHHRVVSI